MLTIQAIQAKKQASYDFNPTFIFNARTDPDQLIEYLEHLKQTSKLASNLPLRERFIFGTDENLTFQGVHWLSADILIQNNEEQFILFESLGSGSGQVKFVQELIYTIFPAAAINLDPTKKQNDVGATCFAFAIDDIRHAYTAHNYLRRVYQKVTGLFDYMESHDHFPLAFMRTTQSRSFFYDGYSSQDYTNRKHYTELELQRPSGKNKPSWNELKKQYDDNGGFSNKSNPNEKLKNLRIKEKLSAMCDLSIAYLIKNVDSQQHFEELTKKFTVRGKIEAASKARSAKPKF